MFDQLANYVAHKVAEAKKVSPPRGARRREVLAFMRDFFNENDQLPPCHIVARHFGFASENAAHCHMVALEKDGLLQKNTVGKWMFARPVPSTEKGAA